MSKDSTPPVVPVGVTSQIGLAVSALLALVAAVSAVSKGDHSEATIEAGAVAAVTLWIVLGGRFAQAHKATSPQPTPQGGPASAGTVNVTRAHIMRSLADQAQNKFLVDGAADDEPGDEDGLNGIQHADAPATPDQGDGGGA